MSQTMRNGDVVGEIDGHAFTISHLIEGQHPRVVDDDLVTEFGRVLARFHNATQQLDIVGSNWLSEPTISQEIAAVDHPPMRLRLQQMRDNVLYLYDAGLPLANIHGDCGPATFLPRMDGSRQFSTSKPPRKRCRLWT